MIRRWFAIGAAVAWAVSSAFAAEPSALAPFRLDPEHPEVVELDGEITPNSALAFRRTLQAAPDARILVLNSPGGAVNAGLLIADDVHNRKLATLIPFGSTCASACAFIFLAGAERRADGQLGVHQMWSMQPDMEGTQLAVADIIDTLDRFGTPTSVIGVMFRTPPDAMHFFTPEEVARLGINKSAEANATKSDNGALAAAPPKDPNGTPRSSPTSLPEKSSSTKPAALPEDTAPAAPALAERTAAALSTLESYTRQPTRMAIYAGLDFLGADLATSSVADAPACAARCMAMNGQCRAFTFNVKTRAGRGPNCFLKSGRGEIDGNSAAFSGEFLSRSDRDPGPMTIAVIDPEADLYQDVDVPGRDLSRRPYPAAGQLECRRACVAEDRCVAFTYVKPKKQCWLKASIGTPRTMPGAVTGGKKTASFEPKVITLD